MTAQFILILLTSKIASKVFTLSITLLVTLGTDEDSFILNQMAC